MPRQPRLHLVPAGDAWVLRWEGSERASGVFDTKAAGLARGREIAANRHGQLIVHKKDGTIETEYTYGHDPRSRKG